MSSLQVLIESLLRVVLHIGFSLFFPIFVFQKQVRSQDAVFVVAGVTGSVLGREKAWKFVQQRWEEFLTRYKGGFLLSRLVKVGYDIFHENLALYAMAGKICQYFVRWEICATMSPHLTFFTKCTLSVDSGKFHHGRTGVRSGGILREKPGACSRENDPTGHRKYPSERPAAQARFGGNANISARMEVDC